jgi:hypothetical protein
MSSPVAPPLLHTPIRKCQVLADETVIKKSINKTRIDEDELRNWCENKLITIETAPAIVPENGSVGSIPRLQEELLIRKQERSGFQ